MKTDWRKIYAGRDAELGELIESWENMKSGGGPHVHVVRGERGMGKTRLVQEFYHHIATHDDPDNYWPDFISTDGSTLLPGPDPDVDPQVKAHFDSFALKDRMMHFLWWGFRIADPQQRNVNTTNLVQHSSSLTPHLVPLIRAREIALLHKKSSLGLLKGALHDTLEDNIADLIEGALNEIPGISTASTIYSISKRVNNVRKTYKRELDENIARQNSSLSVLYNTAGKDVQDSTVEQLKLLDPKFSPSWQKIKKRCESEVPNRIPVIIFIDDSQFTGLNSGTGALSVLARLWTWARLNDFPLLIIATHWNFEWEDGLGRPPPQDPNKPHSFVEGFQPRSKDDRKWFSETILGREVDLSVILSTALPQLSDEDRALILEKCDGNPMLLREMLEKIKNVNADWYGPQGLTKLGRRRLESKQFKLHDLIKARLEEGTPAPIRKAILISALQGVEFIEAVTLKAAEELNIDLGRKPLRLAHSPHAFIDFLDEQKAAFIQRAVYDAALSLIDDNFEDRSDITGALQAATEILIATQSTSQTKGVLDQSQIQNLKGLEIGYGLESDDPEIFDNALEALEAEITAFMEGAGRQKNFATAGELAQKWWEAVQINTSNPINILRYIPAYDALRVLYGPKRAKKLAVRGLNDARDISRQHSKPSHNLQEYAKLMKQDTSCLRQFLTAVKYYTSIRHVMIGEILLGDLYYEEKQFENALKSYNCSHELSIELLAGIGNAQAYDDYNVSLQKLASLTQELHGSKKTLELFTNNLTISRTQLDLLLNRGTQITIEGIKIQLAGPDEETLNGRIITSLRNLGEAEEDLLNDRRARARYEEAVKNSRDLASKYYSINSCSILASSLRSLASFEKRKKNLILAKKTYIESLKIERDLISDFDVTPYECDIAASLLELGILERIMSEFDNADVYLKECRQFCRTLAKQRNSVEDHRSLAQVLYFSGMVKLDKKEFSKSREYYTESYETRCWVFQESSSPTDFYEILVSLSGLARFEITTKSIKQAIKYYEKICDESEFFLKTYDGDVTAKIILEIEDEFQYAIDQKTLLEEFLNLGGYKALDEEKALSNLPLNSMTLSKGGEIEYGSSSNELVNTKSKRRDQKSKKSNIELMCFIVLVAFTTFLFFQLS